MPSPITSSERGSRMGRASGYLALGLLVTAFTAVCTVEILSQVWFQEVNRPGLDCRSGLQGLVQALDRAERAVSQAPASGGTSAALGTFRRSLEPEWGGRDAVALACQRDPRTSKALEQIEQLRYAEEHAVRYEAQNLSPHRRQVRATLSELGLSLGSFASDAGTTAAP